MQSRTKNALITFVIGLALNIGLGVAKIVVGVMSDSSSVTSDALNNLSDAAVSVVTLVATALAARRADHDHPYGHGRYEYIAAFVVGAGVLAVGAEVFIGGVRRAADPSAVDYSVTVLAVLGASIVVKAFMAAWYFVRGRRIGSDTVRAAAVDSASDAAVTAVVLCCAVAERFTGAHIDGYASIAVAAVIVVMAVRILKSTVSRLLGERPDPELYETLRTLISDAEGVISVHDIIINDYGAEKKIAEADAEFPADMTFVAVHEACDKIEHAVLERTGIRLSLHADPHIEGDAVLDAVRARLDEILVPFGAQAHDITVDDGQRTVELDILMPAGVPESELVGQVKAGISAVLPYAVRVNIDYD